MGTTVSKIIVEVVVLVIGWYTTGILVAVMDDDEESMPVAMKVAFWALGMIAAGLSWFNWGAAVALLFILVAILVMAKMMDDKEDKMALRKLGFMIGIPAALATIANIVINSIFNGFKWVELLWLLAPIVFYIVLAIYGRNLVNEKKEKNREPYGKWLAATIALAIAIAVVVTISVQKGVF